jgi:nicotinamide riboside transporter PnuC
MNKWLAILIASLVGMLAGMFTLKALGQPSAI